MSDDAEEIDDILEFHEKAGTLFENQSTTKMNIEEIKHSINMQVKDLESEPNYRAKRFLDALLVAVDLLGKYSEAEKKYKGTGLYATDCLSTISDMLEGKKG